MPQAVVAAHTGPHVVGRRLWAGLPAVGCGCRCVGRCKMSINKTRSSLYKVARLLGDVNAVQRGKTHKRLGRRMAGRHTSRALGKLFR